VLDFGIHAEMTDLKRIILNRTREERGPRRAWLGREVKQAGK